MNIEFFDHENNKVDSAMAASAATRFLDDGDFSGLQNITCRALNEGKVYLQAPVAMFFMQPESFGSYMPAAERESFMGMLPSWRSEIERSIGWSGKTLPGRYLDHDKTGRHYWV